MPGRPFAPFSASSLWYGTDHLLLVESALFKEQYKRFYFKDIQSVAMHRTGIHWVWNFVWGAIALLFGVIALLISGTPYASATICALSLAALVVNLMMAAFNPDNHNHILQTSRGQNLHREKNG